jgi:hypothetical protein
VGVKAGQAGQPPLQGRKRHPRRTVGDTDHFARPPPLRPQETEHVSGGDVERLFLDIGEKDLQVGRRGEQRVVPLARGTSSKYSSTSGWPRAICPSAPSVRQGPQCSKVILLLVLRDSLYDCAKRVVDHRHIYT